MSAAANFYRAARPEPPRCIGLPLRPYSLGHHITLRAFDCSFLVLGSASYADLLLGAFVCSQTWAGWEAWRRSWKFPIFLRLWGWIAGRFDVRAEAEKFAAYIAEGSEAPEIGTPANARALSAAWESRLKLFLVRELRLTLEQAMDYPLALAWQDYCAWAEAEGKITLLSEADKSTLDLVGSDRVKELVAEAEALHRKEVEEMKAKAAAQPEGAN